MKIWCVKIAGNEGRNAFFSKIPSPKKGKT
jgi:hypothetical protein